MSEKDLFNLFHNATRNLSKAPNIAAETVIAAVASEWQKRLDRARAGKYSPVRPNDGMLATLGYRVGSVKGEKTPIRRQIPSHLLELQLPMVGSPAYTDEWGTPKSPKRYWKLNRFLESQLNNPSNNDRPNIAGNDRVA